MTYAQASDVATRLGRPITDAEEIQIKAWLDDVEAAITRGFRRAGLVLAEQVALGDPTDADLISVEARRVTAKVKNPDAKETSVTRSVDDAQVTTRREKVNVEDELDLTDSDWEILLPAMTGGAFSTRPGFEPDTSGWPSVWA